MEKNEHNAVYHIWLIFPPQKIAQIPVVERLIINKTYIWKVITQVLFESFPKGPINTPVKQCCISWQLFQGSGFTGIITNTFISIFNSEVLYINKKESQVKVKKKKIKKGRTCLQRVAVNTKDTFVHIYGLCNHLGRSKQKCFEGVWL